MKLIVGLGNPGEKYEKTRHNLGFLVLDKFLKDTSQVQKTVWQESKKFKCDISQIEWQRRSAGSGQANFDKVILVKPRTYMNSSGLCVEIVSSFYKIEPSDIWIIHDEIDLPLGSMKIKFGGGSAGHKGIISIMNSLGTEKFWRFRLGIGQSKKIQNSEFGIENSDRKRKSKSHELRKVDELVLSVFSRGEAGKAREVIKKGSKSIQEALENGMEKAMNRFNTK